VKVLIAVTHLLGTGHLSRALTLGRAFTSAGHEVRVASGGMPAPQLNQTGVAMIQLPPLRSDGTAFTRLLTGTGDLADPAYLAGRRDMLGSEAASFAPDILMTELFPFGRRVLSDEFLALLQIARKTRRPPVILSSIRDILAPPSKPEKVARADQIIADHYDAVLVHSDPAGTRLEESWPVSEALRHYLRYTGYVAPPAAKPHPEGTGTDEVIVSAGGGDVGAALFAAAIGTARLTPDLPFRLLVGGGDIEALRDAAQGTGAIVEPARPDFRAMLTGAAASVSMCGYNTTMDLLQAGTPAVLVPFDASQEVEQSLRAGALANLPGIVRIASADLTPERLRDALRAVIAAPRRRNLGLRFDGAEQTVAIAAAMARARA